MQRLGLFVLVATLWLGPIGVVAASDLSEQPAEFSQDAAGNWSGTTVSGTPFTQKNVENEAGIRLQRFAIGATSYYISDQGVIWADSNLQAISIYLSWNV